MQVTCSIGHHQKLVNEWRGLFTYGNCRTEYIHDIALPEESFYFAKTGHDFKGLYTFYSVINPLAA
ncbi:hypothetical protein KSL88_19140 [Pectobacterium polaris]|uniref:hypothetical protein n=1 Tax=Pectobacterium polaris TaxID=2042057 RepID=UPI001CC7A3ED|nr:hypothetical protein [Pectobacterium polaris]UAY91571.1 hypothetical protein KSL88_19140 [Pectobacterium polaris]